MSKEFKFVDIPDELLPVIGKADKDTRLYRTEGDESGVSEWFEAVSSVIGRSVSPGGVSMFAPVSRAAVHKRLKQGRLSAFCYHVKRTKTGFFGKKSTIRETPYVYIPVSECQEWAKELKEKMLRLEHVTQEELEGEIPDWSGSFWEWESKWRKERNNHE